MQPASKIILVSSDGESFEVEAKVALHSKVIFNLISMTDIDNSEGIPLPNVTSKILSKVIEYCNMHVADVNLRAWDADFIKVDKTTLLDLVLAANYLDIKGLLDLACQAVAEGIKRMTPEEIRKTFTIKNDEVEEENIGRENQWAFE